MRVTEDNWLSSVGDIELWRSWSTHPVFRYGLAIGLPLLSMLVELALWRYLSPTYFILFYPSVMLTALLAGFGPALLATAISAGLANFVFMPPEGGLTVTPSGVAQVALFTVNCLFISAVTTYFTGQYRKLVATRFDQTMMRMREGYASLDSRLRFSFVNDAMARMMSSNRAAMLGKTPWELLPGLSDTGLQTHLEVARRGKEVALTFHEPSTDRWLDVKAYPTSSGLGVFVADVTDREKARIALERRTAEAIDARDRLRWTNAELVRSNEELAHFAHAASHDLKEPLRMISNYVRLLELRYGDKLDDGAKAYIRFASEGAKRLHTLLGDILSHSNIQSEPLELRPTSLDDCAREAVSLLGSPIGESGATVTIGPLPSLAGDHRQLVRVFQNLISNAVKFRRPDAAPVVRIEAVDEGDAWRISVRDNGIGVEPSQQPRIFELFRRGHCQSEYPGSGIGLATCKKIVERYGGRIRVESSPRQGSIFSFTLPKRPPRNVVRLAPGLGERNGAA